MYEKGESPLSCENSLFGNKKHAQVAIAPSELTQRKYERLELMAGCASNHWVQKKLSMVNRFLLASIDLQQSRMARRPVDREDFLPGS